MTTTLRNSLRAGFAFFALFAFLSTGVAFADSSDKWIHIKVDSAGGEKVTVNLPIALLGAAADMVPPEMQQRIDEETRIAFDEVDMTWGDLREFWDQVRNSPDATYVTVESENETVIVKREGDYMLVETADQNGSGADVNVRFPMAAVDALLSGPEGTLDFKAALEVLAEEDHGHLVSVRDGEDTVKIWIDDQSEAR